MDVHPDGKAGVLVYVGDKNRFSRLSHGPGDPFPGLQADILHRLRGQPDDHGEIQFSGLEIDQQQGPVLSRDDRLDARQDRGEERLHVVGAHQGLGELDGGQQALYLAGVGGIIEGVVFLVHNHGSYQGILWPRG